MYCNTNGQARHSLLINSILLRKYEEEMDIKENNFRRKEYIF